MRPKFRRRRGEEGASLLIALAFMLVFALLVTALLQFSVTSFKASNTIVDRARASYSADAGVDTAIAQIRQDTTMQRGRDTALGGSACGPVSFSGADSTTPEASTSCSALPDSGAVRPGMNNFPANALLTTTGNVTLNGSGTLKTNANVYSDGGINLNGATLDAYDNMVSARQGCSPGIPGQQWITVKAECGISPSAPQYPDGTPPNYVSQVSGNLPLNRGPANCNTTNGIATFSSGYWTDPKKLTNLPGNCLAGVYYFQPGIFYFNFAGRSTLGHIWRINGIVVGGTPRGSWYSAGAVPPTPGANATQSVACDESQAGVQFVFGGDSQVQLDPPSTTAVSSLELCPSTDSRGDRIAIYGGADCTSCNTDQIVTALNPSKFTNNNDYGTNTGNCVQGVYASGGNANSFCTLPQPSSGPQPTTSAIDGLIATSDTNKKSATISFSDFDWSTNALGIPLEQQPDYPAGLQIQSVKIVVRHREPSVGETARIDVSGLTKNGTRTCVATPTPGADAGPWNYDGWAAAASVTPPPAWTPPGTDVLHDALICTNGTGLGNGTQITSTKGGGAGAQDIAKSLQVDYTVDYSGPGNLSTRPPQIDGLQVILTFSPLVIPQGGCVTGSDGFAPCSFINNAAGAAGHAGIWGTTYAPNAFLGIADNSFDFGGAANIVFNRGTIVASADLTGLPLPASDNKGRFRLGNGTGRTVQIVSNSDNQRVRALVRVVDSAAAPGLFAVVRQWSTAKP